MIVWIRRGRRELVPFASIDRRLRGAADCRRLVADPGWVNRQDRPVELLSILLVAGKVQHIGNSVGNLEPEDLLVAADI